MLAQLMFNYSLKTEYIAIVRSYLRPTTRVMPRVSLPFDTTKFASDFFGIRYMMLWSHCGTAKSRNSWLYVNRVSVAEFYDDVWLKIKS